MSQPNNPQHEQMSDATMLRIVAAQAEAIWPQEEVLVRRYALPAGAAILDVGCGPGEIAERLLELLPGASLVGLDLDAAHLDLARRRCARFGERAELRVGDATDLDAAGVAPGSVDLAVCRHLLQAVPRPERVLAEMARVTRPGGRLHVLAEDYGMMHFWPASRDLDAFWRDGPIAFAAAAGETDLRSGRKIFTFMTELGLADVRVDYVVVDTLRVPRPLFARIWTAWRDGYAAPIASRTALSEPEVTACFDEMIAAIENPAGYGVWQVPIISGSVSR